jgi:hypothetical protein
MAVQEIFKAELETLPNLQGLLHGPAKTSPRMTSFVVQGLILDNLPGRWQGETPLLSSAHTVDLSL